MLNEPYSANQAPMLIFTFFVASYAGNFPYYTETGFNPVCSDGCKNNAGNKSACMEKLLAGLTVNTSYVPYCHPVINYNKKVKPVIPCEGGLDASLPIMFEQNDGLLSHVQHKEHEMFAEKQTKTNSGQMRDQNSRAAAVYRDSCSRSVKKSRVFHGRANSWHFCGLENFCIQGTERLYIQHYTKFHADA